MPYIAFREIASSSTRSSHIYISDTSSYTANVAEIQFFNSEESAKTCPCFKHGFIVMSLEEYISEDHLFLLKLKGVVINKELFLSVCRIYNFFQKKKSNITNNLV